MFRFRYFTHFNSSDLSCTFCSVSSTGTQLYCTLYDPPWRKKKESESTYVPE